MTRSGRVLALPLAFAVGIGLGGAAGILAHDSPNRSPRHLQGVAAKLPPSRLVVPDTILAWTPGGLPRGFALHVRKLSGVARAVPVVSGTAWLTRSATPDGVTVDHPPEGLAIPLEVAGADLRRYGPFLSPSDRVFLPELASGQAVLGSTSSRLRRLGPGGVLWFGSSQLRMAGLVPDTEIGGHELFVSRGTAKRLGVTRERYLLIDPAPGVSHDRLVARIRGLLPPAVPLRIRGPGQTPYLRQGDAVLPPVLLKTYFGEFAARPAPGGFLKMDPAWEAAHIVTASVPILGPVTCNRAILPQLRGALGELQRESLSQLIDTSQFGGCYSPRFLLRDPTASISHHTWGIAVDINVGANPFGHTPHQDPRLVSIFERWGFIWGGRFLVPDGMHFEFVRFTSG